MLLPHNQHCLVKNRNTADSFREKDDFTLYFLQDDGAKF